MTKRQEINQALAKALAYAECGKFEEAQRWGEVLLRKLELAAVFKAGSVNLVTDKADMVHCLKEIVRQFDADETGRLGVGIVNDARILIGPAYVNGGDK